jgi:ribosomal protein S18 acetylase RimI-like enzyme
MTVRPATKDDITAMRHIAHETWPVTYGKIQSKEQLDYMLDLMYSPSALELQFDNGHLFFIAENENGLPIGFAGTSEQEPCKSWKLHKLYVLPNIQKSGAGRALMQMVVDTAKAHNATELLLNVNRNNPAYTYYLKNGFEVAETVDIPIGGGFFMNDYVMKKLIW